jgi:anti-sigma28 factor (negative regulator of flagellin synthesis)
VRALREALAGADRARRARLERLRKAVREGSYAIPVAALAAAMQREGRLFNATVPL